MNRRTIGFVLDGREVSLVAGSERDNDEVLFFEVDPATRGLIPVGSVNSDIGVAGLLSLSCLLMLRLGKYPDY